MIVCKRCGKETKERTNKKFCSDVCKNRYNSKLNAGKWAKRNPKKRAKIQLANYYKNKGKYMCRTMTKQIFISDGNVCKICGNRKNLQIHHEVYPPTMKGIRKAIKNKKIYLLCKGCHKMQTFK